AARERVIARRVEGMPAKRERARGIADAFDIESRNLLLEAALAEQHIRGRYAAIVEIKRTPLLVAHEARRLAYRETWRAAFHQDRADSTNTRPIADLDQEESGIAAVGGENLAALDDEFVAFAFGRRAQIGDGVACVGFGHAEADELASCQEI